MTTKTCRISVTERSATARRRPRPEAGACVYACVFSWHVRRTDGAMVVAYGARSSATRVNLIGLYQELG